MTCKYDQKQRTSSRLQIPLPFLKVITFISKIAVFFIVRLILGGN